MKKTATTILLYLLAFASDGLCADTTVYEFVEGSTLTQISSQMGPDRLYPITGSFQFTVYPDQNTARFDWVEAVAESDSALETTSLNDLFRMTDLVGTAVNETTFQFSPGPSGSGFSEQIDLTVTFADGAVQIQGERNRGAWGFRLLIDAVANPIDSQWTYRYFDDFSTDKAKRDSYTHSVFWPDGAFPPPGPHLQFADQHQMRRLAFIGSGSEPAHLGYRFPIHMPANTRMVQGRIEVDVALQANAGYLACALSFDGLEWSTPERLTTGHNTVNVNCPRGVCRIMFFGNNALIDNLKVRLHSAEAAIRVPDDYSTIQHAIDAASDGDIIEVAPGVYRGAGNTDIDFLGKAVTLRSQAGPELTVINCSGPSGLSSVKGPGGQQQNRRGFYFHSGETPGSILKGFTILGGRVRGSEIPADHMRWNLDPSHPIGGGIYCEFSSPTIINCVVRDCGAEYGGAIGCVGASPVIADCIIEECRAGGLGPSDSGGYGAGIALIRQSAVRIIDSVIRINSCYYNSYGVGVYCKRSRILLSDCDISFNRAVNDNAITYGGGMFCEGANAKAVIRNCIFSHNSAHMGSAVLARSEASTQEPACRLDIKNCTIANNKTIQGPWLKPESDAAVQSEDSDLSLSNSIIWHNEGLPLAVAGPTPDISYCNIEGGHQGRGNIDSDPLFAPVGARDYHLQSVHGRFNPATNQWTLDQAHSPCIDAGDPRDYFGSEPQPNGKRVNMGAYGGGREASKGKGALIYHVNAIDGDNSNTGLSRRNAFKTIQRGIDVSQDGDLVLVWPGLYAEQVSFNGKAITVQSAADAAIVSASQGYAFSFFMGETSRSVLRNFVIADGEYGVFCQSASPTISNLTVANNAFGISAYAGAAPQISNCIFWNNLYGDLFQCSASHSCIEHQTEAAGVGNITDDPLFADADAGDYHLRSRYGRYDSHNKDWASDLESSPCIDAGDPNAGFGRERPPNGGRLNMGAYGRTPYASLSKPRFRADLDKNDVLDARDLRVFASQWLKNAPRTPSDLDEDGIVNIRDFAVLCGEWRQRIQAARPGPDNIEMPAWFRLGWD